MLPARAVAVALLLAWPLQTVDDATRAWVQGLRGPALEGTMRAVSDKSRLVLIVGGVLAAVSGAGARAGAIEAAIALLPVNLAVEGLKWGVGRTRPDGDSRRRNSSFPSSHAANAFTVAAVITRRARKAAIPAWFAASLVAFSRMYLDRHWLSDVLFGCALALAGAWLAATITHRWRKAREVARTS